jgi:hypothetical protein
MLLAPPELLPEMLRMEPGRRGWVEPRRMGDWNLGRGVAGTWVEGARCWRVPAPGIGIKDDDTDHDSNLVNNIYVLSTVT